MLDVTIDHQLIRIGERFAVGFHRTLRIPDDGRIYPLPPGLGHFPVFNVSAYRDKVPPQWLEEVGAFIPMYQREALWIGFHGAEWKPNAVKIAVGGINVISGEPFKHGLDADPQDYIVCPDQPWLDGINTGRGFIRQFVAMPLGMGYTIEASLTGKEEFGGIQVTVFEPKPGRFPDKPPKRSETGPVRFAVPKTKGAPESMGLGAGGKMKQKIYPDPYGIDVWDQDNSGHVGIHIVNSAQFFELTGIHPPPTPVDIQSYTEHGLPWFDLYDEAKADIPASDKLTGAETITEIERQRGESIADDKALDILESQIKTIGKDASESPGRQPSHVARPGSPHEGKGNKL